MTFMSFGFWLVVMVAMSVAYHALCSWTSRNWELVTDRLKLPTPDDV